MYYDYMINVYIFYELYVGYLCKYIWYNMLLGFLLVKFRSFIFLV